MSTDKSSSHISQRYDDELSGVKSQLFEMGGIVEKQVKDAINRYSMLIANRRTCC